MQILFRILSRNLVTNCRQSMRAANLKTLNIKEKHGHLFDRMIEKPGLIFLKDVFIQNGFGIRIAGGAVRDLICEKVPDDIDLATTAPPQKMIEMLKNFSNVRLITTKAGERHGTIIARVDDLAQYEITTLRIDKITDGRHAEVEFIEDWKLDASRRDLTFNSLFLDFDGIVYDYFNGIEHLKSKKVLFVGDPIERMEEDYLRILRYFRFYIRYGNLIDHDQEVIDAIEKCKEGLQSISGPRICTELKKILGYSNSLTVLDLIFNELKLGIYMGFNSNTKSIEKLAKIYENLSKFNELVEKSKNLTKSNQPNDLNLDESDRKMNYVSIIAGLTDSEQELNSLRERLSLSNQELYSASAIIHYRDSKIVFDFNRAKKELVLTHKSEKDRKKSWLFEVFKYQGDLKSYLSLKNQSIPVFPNIGQQLFKRIEKKSQISQYIEKLTLIWIESDYKMTGDELLQKFDELYAKEEPETKRLKTDT